MNAEQCFICRKLTMEEYLMEFENVEDESDAYQLNIPCCSDQCERKLLMAAQDSGTGGEFDKRITTLLDDREARDGI